MIRANDDSRERVEAFLSRFHGFDDAVVRRFTLSVGPAGEKAVVSLEARDLEAQPDQDWVEVRLTVEGVTEYRLSRNDREYHYVLSLGLKVDCFEKTYYFDFGPVSDAPDRLEDFRGSNFYVAGGDYHWKIMPYPKSWDRNRRHVPPLGSNG
jgi:hypothetical protein